MTFRALASNLRLSPTFSFLPPAVKTMKLDVILESARELRPTSSDALKEGKYRIEIRLSTMLLNFSFSALSEGKNCKRLFVRMKSRREWQETYRKYH